MKTLPHLLFLSLTLIACGPVRDAGTSAEDGNVIGADESALGAGQGHPEGWKTDDRVAPQVGFYFGRSGAPNKTPADNYTALSPLTLPVDALVANGVPLFDVQADDLAQIDFFVLSARSARTLELGHMFDASLDRVGLPREVDLALRASLKNVAPVLKEVRLRSPASTPLPTELSRLPANAFVAFDAEAYFTVFVTQEPGQQGSALDGFRAQIAGGAYVIGDSAALPNIPHPQDAHVALIAMMTVRATEPLHGKTFVLEVIETH